jgi:hypothetical protein
MDMRKYSRATYIKLDHVRCSPLRERIKDVRPGNYDKPDLIFESGAVLSANKTSVAALIKAFGDDSRDWVGCEVELYHGQVDLQGNATDSVLVRPLSDKAAAAFKKTVDDADDLDQPIPFN